MTAITSTNTDYTILGQVKTALSGATIDGAAVFGTVSMASSDQQAREGQFKGSFPLAILRYLGTEEDTAPEDYRNCVLRAEIIVATKTDSSGPDETTRMQEILRLVNAAKNAVESAAPAGATGGADSDFFHEPIEWGSPTLRLLHQPWIVGAIPVSFGYVLLTPTAH